MGKQCNPNEKGMLITWADLVAKKDQKHVSDTLRKNREPVNQDALKKGIPDNGTDKRKAVDRLFKH